MILFRNTLYKKAFALYHLVNTFKVLDKVLMLSKRMSVAQRGHIFITGTFFMETAQRRKRSIAETKSQNTCQDVLATLMFAPVSKISTTIVR